MDRLSQYRSEEAKLKWEGSFANYFELVKKNPKIARLAHARIFDMIMVDGVQAHGENEPPTYDFFSQELYGVDHALRQVVDYFSSAAQRLEVRKRILLLMVPVGGGKSTIVSLLKRGLEVHSRTDDGAVYAIKGCPMHEEPLHLIPDVLRAEVERDFGIYIEGDLCPHCRYMVDHEYQNRVEDVQVERIVFSEKHRNGIGTFTPSDPKSQDISELVGGIDLSTIGEVGVESDPRAYRFDGELNIANRGLMEFIEMLKCDEKFLYVLLTLSQEQNIKIGRFSMISRLEPPKKAGMSLMKKLRLYDGQDVEGFNRKDAKELQEETVREGMDGISPRYVINRLSSALIREGITCINPIAALRSLRDGLDQHTSINKADRERYLNLIDEARREYDDMAKTEVQKAFVYSFEESARTLLNNYLDNVEAFCNRQKVRDPFTDDEV